ncbi:DNA polymerase eta [Teleopsis dalmanni]|uniref:DNA polymerase eta n=1 Tax=Teleopsis dalmanni TaxID=139649 RepID=UPI0018CCD55F|nr:DNA polymerase eta [Teleopsis dalmanni]
MAAPTNSTRNFISMQNKYDRIILLVDMDCFYCQVEEKLDPTLKGKPIAVVQYNAWRGGGIIAVNYAARAKGVTRHMRGDEAKAQCPDIELVKVPNVREKADLTKYREAGKDVANVLQKFTDLLERASVDEAYLDITASVNNRLEAMNNGTFVLQPQILVNTYAVGYAHIGEYINKITVRLSNPYVDDNQFNVAYNPDDIPSVRQSDIRLLIGASIASEIRAEVKSVTGYECSAGVAHNKILAKLACGINKPNKQTILPLSEIPRLFETLPLGKIKGLGGKFGEDVCERLQIRFLGELLQFSESEIQKKFDEKNGSWLYYICRGIDLEAVIPRFYSKSIGCCKKFPGRNNITGINTLKHWLNELGNEINERLEKDVIENNRKAKQMVVSFVQEFNNEEIASSRSAPLTTYDGDGIAKNAFDIIKSNTKQFFRKGSEAVLNNPIKFLGISVGKFETIISGQSKLQQMFANQMAKKRKSVDYTEENEERNISQNVNDSKIAKVSSSQGTSIKSFFAKSGKDNVNNSSINKQSEKCNNDIITKFSNAGQDSKENEIQNGAINLNENKNVTIKSFFLKTDQNNDFINQSKKHNRDTRSELPTVDIDLNEQDDLSVESYNNETNVLKETIEENCNENNNVKNIKSGDSSYFLNVITKKEAGKHIDEEHSSIHQQNQNSSTNDTLNNIIEQEELDGLEQEIELVINEPQNNIHKFDNVVTNEESSENEISEKQTKRVKLSEENIGCDQTSSLNYKNIYAEFAIPELRPDLLSYIKCEQCGAKIPDDHQTIQTHKDHHFAQELSQQLRNEYRTEIQAKMTISNSGNANKKIKKPSDPKANKTDITKYLKTTIKQREDERSILSEEPTTSLQAILENELNEKVACKECNAFVRKSELLEHNDYHIAKALQKDINRLEVRTVEIVKKENPTQSRKSLNKSIMNPTNKATTNKSITTFFTQKSSQ